jgi:hypothetical protein
MGKVITSPVEKFPGTVTLYDPVPYPAFITWQKAIRKAGEIADTSDGETQLEMFKGAEACIESWNIEGFDISEPVATPRTPVVELLGWLVTEIGKVFNADDPN